MMLFGEKSWIVCALIFISVGAVHIDAIGQVGIKNHKTNREINFSYDNDVYFGTDQYYSSGATLHYSRLVDHANRLYHKLSKHNTDSSKLIIRYSYGHKIFTPNKIKVAPQEILKGDRPYAGWHFMGLSVDNFPSINSKNSYRLTLGMVGDKSGIGNFHEWWHDKLNMPHPTGWDSEIQNELVLNLGYNRLQTLKIYKGMDLVTDSKLTLGNGSNQIGQAATVRWGKVNPIDNSTFAHSRLSHTIPQLGNPSLNEEELFIFYGWDANYVLSNIFIQGSIFNDRSPLTKDIEPFVFIRKYGFMYSNHYASLAITVYKISREIVDSDIQRYISLEFAFRY
jgi:hypothetical protein